MDNSIKSIYSIYIRLKHMNDFNLWNDYEFDNILNDVSFISYKNKYIINQCKRIYSEIESGWYKRYDIILFTLNEYLHDRKFDFSQIGLKSIQNLISIYSNERVDVDKQYIIDLQKIVKLKSIVDYFLPTECGEPYIYQLVVKDIISPLFYIKYRDKVLTKISENGFLFSSNARYIRFEKISELINNKFIKNQSK